MPATATATHEWQTQHLSPREAARRSASLGALPQLAQIVYQHGTHVLARRLERVVAPPALQHKLGTIELVNLFYVLVLYLLSL